MMDDFDMDLIIVGFIAWTALMRLGYICGYYFGEYRFTLYILMFVFPIAFVVSKIISRGIEVYG